MIITDRGTQLKNKRSGQVFELESVVAHLKAGVKSCQGEGVAVGRESGGRGRGRINCSLFMRRACAEEK